MENYDTKHKILKMAKLEFFEKGFEKASLRKISLKANVSTGAIYGNFKNKETLFNTLVETEATTLFEMFTKSQTEFEKLDSLTQKNSMDVICSKYMNEMLDYIYKHFDKFKLIICYSKGTVYENYRDRFIEKEEHQTKKFINLMKQNNKLVYEPSEELIHMLCASSINGFFEIIEHSMKKINAKEYISKLHEFNSAGWKKLLF